MDEVSGYCDNERFRKSQFLKYMSPSPQTDDDGSSCFLGMFDDNGRCLSMAYLNKVPDGFILIAEIQSIVRGNGKPLIEFIISKSANLWWMADPAGGESLLDYYRRFNLEEATIYGGKTAFYKTDGPENKETILQFLREHCF